MLCAGGTTMIGCGTALTASSTPDEPDRLSVASWTLSRSKSVPAKPLVGVYTSPSRAAFKFASDPVTVIEDESLDVVPKFRPVVEPKVSVPLDTISVSESEGPTAGSTRSSVPLNVKELSSFKATDCGAEMAGAPLTVIGTLADAVRRSPGSVSRICSASGPIKPALGE